MTRQTATPYTSGPAQESAPGPDGARLLAAITRRIAGVLGSVTGLGGTATALADRAAGAGHPLRRADLAAIRPHVAGLLHRHRDLVAGAGLVMAPGVLADEHRWIEWWWAGDDGGVNPLEVDLNPESAEFYDYTTNEWYREPARTGQPWVAGPYVDYICTHKYTFTLSAPLVRDGTFLGVAGADILACQVERAVLPGLAQLRRPAVLVSGHGRVIASNTPGLLPGSVLGQLCPTSALRPVAGPDPAGTILPWTLLAAGSPAPHRPEPPAG
jgi:methyl-accepting chemotaxis protein-like sensor